MIHLLLIQIFTSFLLAGAHALRSGNYGLAAGCIVAGTALLSRKAWIRSNSQILLSGAALAWITITAALLTFRIRAGQPFTVLLIIMGTVILFTISSVIILNFPSIKKRFSDGAGDKIPLTAIFLITIAVISFAEVKAPSDLLLFTRYFPGWEDLQILIMAFYAVWAGGGLLDRRSAIKRRTLIWTIFSAVFFAQLTLGIAGMDRMLMTGKLHIPLPALIAAGPVYRGGGFFMPILYGSTLLLAGGAWCSHLCYIGAWDHLASRSGKISPHALPSWIRWIRPALLMAVITAAYLLRKTGSGPGTAALAAMAFALAGVWVMLFISRRRGMMVHCTSFCPIGIISNIAGKLSPWRIKIDHACHRCGACTEVCKYGALEAADFKRGAAGLTCTLCGDCTAVCPGEHIKYTFPGLKGTRPRIVFIVIITVLHTLFLAVARI